MKRLLVLAALAVSAVLGIVPQATATHVSCGDTLTQNTVLDSLRAKKRPSRIGAGGTPRGPRGPSRTTAANPAGLTER